jgi:hypothetical protein
VRGQADLVLTAAAAVLACAAAGLGAPVPLTAVLGLAVLAAPGYLLAQGLLGSQVAGLERLAVTTGLVLCVPILGGLLLYASGVPLHRAGWVGLLAGLTLLGDAALLVRRRRGQAGPFRWPRVSRRRPIRHLAACGAAAVMAIGALVLTSVSAASQHYPGFTQLWLIHSSRSTGRADLGVGNYEGQTVRYRLVLLRDGHPATSWDLTLAAGRTWQQSPPLTAGDAFSANLYKLPDLAHPYRHVAIGASGTSRS